jgi:hypothetical protein
MAKPELDLVELFLGEHGVLYEPRASLSERVWAVAKLTRRSFEQAGYVARSQNALLPEKAKQIVEQYEGKQRGFLGTGVVLGELGEVGHG